MTRIPGRVLGALIVAALAAGGCGSAPAPARPAVAAPPASHQLRAQQDAAANLASFVPPPGARRLAAAPSAYGGALKIPGEQLGTPALVDRAAWWLVPGGHQQAIDWAAAHRPPGSTIAVSGSEERDGVTSWEDQFDLPSVPGVLDSRSLVVTAVDAGGGQAAIRVDAEDSYLPGRPAAEAVPAAAAAVTLTLVPDGNVQVTPPAPVTITDPAKVRQLKALVDGLPLFPPGSDSCPFGDGAALVLSFAARPQGRALAVATVELDACQVVDFSVGGKQQPGLGQPDGGQQVAAQALRTAGLNWKVASYTVHS